MTKRIVLLIIASMAAGVCSLAQEVRFTADPAVKKIQVLDIQSSSTSFECFGYSVNNLNDDNLCTECAIESDDGNECVDVVFTLAEKHIGTFLMYDGYYNGLKLVDIGSGKVLGDYKVSIESNQPYITVVNKDLTRCENGEYRIRVSFEGISPVQGTEFGEQVSLFCISEVSFWKDNVINPVWPVGDRAVYEVRGPVKMIKCKELIDNKKKVIITEFDRNGMELFREGATVDDCTIGEQWWSPQGDIIIEYTAKSSQGGTHKLSYWRRYDDKRRLIASGASCAEKDDNHDCGLMWGIEEPCPGITGSFSYTGNDFLQASVDPGGQGYTVAESFEYERGLLRSVHESFTTHGGGDFEVNRVYTILAVDKYGNWTKRKCEVEIRQDSIYYGADDGEDVHYESFTEEREIFYY